VRLSLVSGERTTTRSIFMSSILRAASSEIISFSRTMTSSVLGLTIVERLTRPTIWSRRGTSIFSPL